MEELCKALGIKRAMSTAYHPQTDGQTERIDQEVKVFLRHYINCKGDWSGTLQEIPQLNYSLRNMLQPTSRRFLRELDEAPEGNNLHYIYYSVLVSLLW